MTTLPILPTAVESNGPGQSGDRDSHHIYHVADLLKRYPGELVNFSTYFQAGKHWNGGVVSVSLPEEMELVDYSPPAGGDVEGVLVRDLPEGLAIDWCLGKMAQKEELVMTIAARVLDPGHNAYLLSTAELRDSRGDIAGEETVQVAVRVNSKTMQYLPEIYHDNELMNQLLMLFESFWQPVDLQIDQPDVYYDPKIAPLPFLNWLASWIGIPLDENIPIGRKRELLESALTLYQRYGTRSAMEKYLHLYTGGNIEIIEHRGHNFRLGSSAQLGPTIALGKTNFPSTFTVKVRMPRKELQRMFGDEQVNREKLVRSRIEGIIEAQKPAHTAYRLELRFED